MVGGRAGTEPSIVEMMVFNMDRGTIRAFPTKFFAICFTLAYAISCDPVGRGRCPRPPFLSPMATAARKDKLVKDLRHAVP